MKIPAGEIGIPLFGVVGPRFIVKQTTVKRCVAALLLISVASIFYYTHYIISSPFSRWVNFFLIENYSQSLFFIILRFYSLFYFTLLYSAHFFYYFPIFLIAPPTDTPQSPTFRLFPVPYWFTTHMLLRLLFFLCYCHRHVPFFNFATPIFIFLLRPLPLPRFQPFGLCSAPISPISPLLFYYHFHIFSFCSAHIYFPIPNFMFAPPLLPQFAPPFVPPLLLPRPHFSFCSAHFNSQIPAFKFSLRPFFCAPPTLVPDFHFLFIAPPLFLLLSRPLLCLFFLSLLYFSFAPLTVYFSFATRQLMKKKK